MAPAREEHERLAVVSEDARHADVIPAKYVYVSPTNTLDGYQLCANRPSVHARNGAVRHRLNTCASCIATRDVHLRQHLCLLIARRAMGGGSQRLRQRRRVERLERGHPHRQILANLRRPHPCARDGGHVQEYHCRGDNGALTRLQTVDPGMMLMLVQKMAEEHVEVVQWTEFQEVNRGGILGSTRNGARKMARSGREPGWWCSPRTTAAEEGWRARRIIRAPGFQDVVDEAQEDGESDGGQRAVVLHRPLLRLPPTSRCTWSDEEHRRGGETAASGTLTSPAGFLLVDVVSEHAALEREPLHHPTGRFVAA